MRGLKAGSVGDDVVGLCDVGSGVGLEVTTHDCRKATEMPEPYEG